MASTAHRSRMSLGLLLKVIVFVTLIKEMKGEPESFLEKRGPSLFYEAHLAVFVNSEDFILLKDVKKKEQNCTDLRPAQAVVIKTGTQKQQQKKTPYDCQGKKTVFISACRLESNII